MGQKVHPNGARVGVIRDWSTRWYSGKKGFADLLIQDQKLRGFLSKRLAQASVSRVDLERAAQRVTVKIHTAKPGIVIGRGGSGIEQLKKDIVAFLEKDNRENHGKTEKVTVSVDIVEIKVPDIDAKLVAENIAQQLEKRISFRRAMKQSLSRAMKAGAKGIKTQVSGRLGGAEIARTEGYKDGSVPLQTLRANIDYGFTEAKTAYGRIGVKVWIYKGQVLPPVKKAQPVAAEGGR